MKSNFSLNGYLRFPFAKVSPYIWDRISTFRGTLTDTSIIAHLSGETIVAYLRKPRIQTYKHIIPFVLFVLALVHIGAGIIQILLFENFLAERIGSYVIMPSIKGFFVSQLVLAIVLRFVEGFGLFFKQFWGWFLAQFAYFYSLPLLLFNSVFLPGIASWVVVLLAFGILFFLYLPPVLVLFKREPQFHLRFVLQVWVVNLVLSLLLQWVLIYV